MAIALLNHATGVYDQNPDITSWSFPIPTITGGADNILEIAIVIRSANNSQVTAVTVGSQSASLIRQQLNGGVPNTEVWGIVNPTPGSNVTCQITWDLAITQKVAARAREIDGTNGSISGLTTAGASGTASNSSQTPATVASDYCMDTLGIQGTTTTTAGSGQTEDSDIVAGTTAQVHNSGSREEATGSSTTMSWTHASIARAHAVVVYKPATPKSLPPWRRQVLLVAR